MPLFYSKMCWCQFLFLNKLEKQSCGKYSGVKAISHNIEVQWNSDWQVSICEQQQGGSMPRSITDAPHTHKLKWEGEEVCWEDRGGGVFDLHSRCCGRLHSGSQTALASAGCRHTPGRSDTGCGKTPHACFSLSTSLESSSGSPGEWNNISIIRTSYRHCELQCWDSRWKLATGGRDENDWHDGFTPRNGIIHMKCVVVCWSKQFAYKRPDTQIHRMPPRNTVWSRINILTQQNSRDICLDSKCECSSCHRRNTTSISNRVTHARTNYNSKNIRT